MRPAEAGEQEREVCVRLVLADHRVGLLEPLDRLLVQAEAILDDPEPTGGTGGRMGVAAGLVQVDRLLEEPGGAIGVGACQRHLARSAQRRGPIVRLGSEVCGLLEIAACLGRGAERACPGARVHQRLVRLPAQALAVVGLRVEAVRVEQVGGDDLGHLFLAERRREMFGGRQVLLPPFALRQGLVGDVPQQVLQERVLALLR